MRDRNGCFTKWHPYIFYCHDCYVVQSGNEISIEVRSILDVRIWPFGKCSHASRYALEIE